MAAAAPAFALAPGLIGANQILDYNDANTMKLFKAATETLPNKFDLKPDNLKAFLAEVEVRASCHGWDYMFDIPLDQADQDDTRSLIHQYGKLTKLQVEVEVETYMGEEVQAAQDNYAIYHCLMNSLTKEAKDKLLLLRAE